MPIPAPLDALLAHETGTKAHVHEVGLRVGAFLQAERERRGLTRREVAEAIGCDVVQVWRTERTAPTTRALEGAPSVRERYITFLWSDR